MDIEKAKGLKLYKVPLENDLIVDLDIGFGSEDHFIEKYIFFWGHFCRNDI